MTPLPRICLLALLLAPLALRAQDTALPVAEVRRLADGLFARGMHRLALEEYERLLALDPPPPEADLIAFRAGESARLGEDAATARRHYERAIRDGGSGETALRARLRLAEMQLREQRDEEARNLLEPVLVEKAPQAIDAPARFLLGQIHERAGRMEDARSSYQALLRQYPEDVMAVYAALGLARIERKDPEQRRHYYQLALRNPPSAELEVEALWGLATLEAETGTRDRAADLFERLWARHPDSARVRGGMLQIAWALMQAGRHARALEIAAQASDERKRDHTDTWLYLEAISRRETGDEAGSRTALQRLLANHPDSRFRPVAAYDLAVLLARAGEPAAILPLAEDMLNVPGRRIDALWLLAESARAADRRPLAFQYLTELSRIPEPNPRAADARHLRALLLQDQDPRAAVDAWTDFVRLHPRDPRAPAALLAAGSLRLAQGDAAAALDLWTRALREYPDHPQTPELEFQTALLLIRLQRPEAAIALLTRYAARSPVPPRRAEAAFWIGTLLDQAGKGAEAEPWLRTALEGDLPADTLARARLRLGLLLQRSGKDADSIHVLAPLLSLTGESALPDGLLNWMLDRTRTLGLADITAQVASAMIQTERAPATRELGHYTLARMARAQGRNPEAIASFRAGLALGSNTLDAAEAGLELGELLVAAGAHREAMEPLATAMRLAANLERPRLQAATMHNLARAHAGLGEWAEAARLHMSVGVLFDDPELTPASLSAAALAFEKAGRPADAAAARRELALRYPASAPQPPDALPSP